MTGQQSIHVAYAGVLLLLLTAGCASVTSDVPVSQPQVAAPQPAAPQPAAPQPAAPQPATTQPATPPQPAATPTASATPQPAPAAASEPNVTTSARQAASKATPPAAKKPAPIAPALRPAAPPAVVPLAPALTPTLDLAALKERLKETKAIGIFTKISLKNKVDDLLDQFRGHYQGKATPTMTELRRSYDLLMMKVLSLLQDTDQNLASAIVSSREAIWGLLADRNKFATLQS